MPAENIAACRVCGATGQDEVVCEGCGALLPAVSSPATETDLPDAHSRARPLVIPVADPAQAGQAEQIKPMLPGVPEPAVPTVRGPDRDDVATGPPCPWCGAPNPLDRHFCLRCAMLLALRPDPARLPWWRRMLRWCRQRWRGRKLPYAGQRPRLRHGYRRFARWLALAAAVSLAAITAGAWGGTAVTDVKDHFARRYQVFPTTLKASHSDPAHRAANLDDGFNNTWWGTGVVGDGAGVSVSAAFEQPVNLLDVIIIPGAGVEQDAFTAESRPESVKVTLLRANGSKTSTTITLADSPGPETFAIQGSDVESVRLTLQAAYLAQSSSPTEVAIAEVEFFASGGG